jgi:hypothetical protein
VRLKAALSSRRRSTCCASAAYSTSAGEAASANAVDAVARVTVFIEMTDAALGTVIVEKS